MTSVHLRLLSSVPSPPHTIVTKGTGVSHLLCLFNNYKINLTDYVNHIRRIIMHEVFGITKKSIHFFVNMFNINRVDENGIRKFVEVEYKPRDRQWAYHQIKDSFLK